MGTPTTTGTPTVTATPTPWSYPPRFIFQPYDAEPPPGCMKDGGQSYGTDEEGGNVPESGIEIEYGWL